MIQQLHAPFEVTGAAVVFGIVFDMLRFKISLTLKCET